MTKSTQPPKKDLTSTKRKPAATKSTMPKGSKPMVGEIPPAPITAVMLYGRHTIEDLKNIIKLMEAGHVSSFSTVQPEEPTEEPKQEEKLVEQPSVQQQP